MIPRTGAANASRKLTAPIIPREGSTGEFAISRPASASAQRLRHQHESSVTPHFAPTACLRNGQVAITVTTGAHWATMMPQEPILSEMLRTTLKRIAHS